MENQENQSSEVIQTVQEVIHPWVIIGQPAQFLGSNEGGLWVFYDPSKKQWAAGGKNMGIDNKIDLICEGTTKLVKEANFVFFKVTPNDNTKAVFLSPSLTTNSFVGYNCKVNIYRREDFDFNSTEVSSTTPEISNLEKTD